MTRWRPFVILEASTVLAGTATGITMVAFPWLVLQTPGDATSMATIAAAASVPLLLSLLFTGSLVDRFGRRPVSVVSDVFSMVSVALVPILAATVGLGFGLLLAVAALGAVFDAAGITARQTMLPEAAQTAGLTLERANGIHEGAYGFAFLVGPAIGGLLIGLVGAATTFWATAGAFALSALLIAVTRIPGGGRPAPHEKPIGLWTSTREGLAFRSHDRVLRTVAILTALLVAVWLPLEGVVLPVYFTATAQPLQLGLLITAMGAGGVAGALVYAAYGRRVRRRAAFVMALIGCAVPAVGLAFLPPYPVMVGLGVLTGFFFGPVNPIANLAMQRRTPEALRGRVIGVMGSAAYVAGPLGYLVAGPLISALGLQRAFLVMTLVLLTISIAAAFLPGLRGLDDPALPGSAADPRPAMTSLNPDLRLAEGEQVAASRSTG